MLLSILNFRIQQRLKITFYLAFTSLFLISCNQIKNVHNLTFSRKPYIISSFGGKSKIATHIQFHDSTFTEISYNYNKIDTIGIKKNEGNFSQKENKVSLYYKRHSKPSILKLMHNKLIQKKTSPLILNKNHTQ